MAITLKEKNSINNTSETVNDYIESKNFAFLFDFADNDFASCIEHAAEAYCKEYNYLLEKIKSLSNNGDDVKNMLCIESYKGDIEFMEDPKNVREIMKSLFISEYISHTAEPIYYFRINGTKYNATQICKKAQNLAEYYFPDDVEDDYTDWKFGTWEEIEKFGLKEYEDQMSEEGIKRANGDFSKYYLNGEVLIVRMVNGKLKAEVL